MSEINRAVHRPEQLEECLAGIAAGDRQAFESLYRMTEASVYAFAFSILKNSHDAQDVAHDAYLRIYSAAPFYRKNGTPMAWILTVVKNLCTSRLRESKKAAEIAPEEWDQHLPPQEDEDRETRLVLNEALKNLSDEERQILILHAVADLKHRQIAELLGIPLSTVLSKYRRTLKKLERLL